MDLVFRPSLPRNLGERGTGGKELFYLEEFRNMRPKSYGRHFETELSIGNMGKYDETYSFWVDVFALQVDFINN